MSYKLEKPYTNIERADFIVLHNHQNGRTIEETETAIYALEAWEKLVDEKVTDNTEEYKKEQAAKEAERISMLNLTAADVERAIYKAKGIDFEDIVSLLESTSQVSENSIDIKALKIELKANNFYRGNPYIDTVGTILELTSEQLDRFFDTNDYRYLTTVTLIINSTPSDATVIINGEEKTAVTLPYGTAVEYSVAKEGYLTQSGSVELKEDTTLDVELVEEPVEEENVNNENDYSQNEGENVNNEVEGEETPAEEGEEEAPADET